jgi:hypothetical protein
LQVSEFFLLRLSNAERKALALADAIPRSGSRPATGQTASVTIGTKDDEEETSAQESSVASSILSGCLGLAIP